MTSPPTPVLDPRDAAAVLRELLARRPAYLPAWLPAEGSSSQALLQTFARLVQIAIERLDRAPDKNLLAFLDMLGISLIPSQAARAPVVFQVSSGSSDGRARAGTRLGAKTKDAGASTLMFETEQAIALAAARLVEVVSLWPGHDTYADHSAAVAGGRSFTLFDPLQPGQHIQHILYLAHDTLLAFAGKASLDITVTLAAGKQGALAALPIAWEYWNGQGWAKLTVTTDSTDGLSQSGVITLTTDDGTSANTTVNGISAYWVRGCLTSSLPPQSGAALPRINSIMLHSVIERTLHPGNIGVESEKSSAGWVTNLVNGCVSDLQPDNAVTDGNRLDISKAFLPLGQAPRVGAAFYFTSDEVFSKPGAQVTVCFHKAKTRDQEANDEVKQFEVDVNNAQKQLIDAAGKATKTVNDAVDRALGVALPTDQTTKRLEDARQAMNKAEQRLSDTTFLKNLAERISNLAQQADNVVVAMNQLSPKLYLSLPTFLTRQDICSAAVKMAQDAKSILTALSEIGPTTAAVAGGSGPPALSPARLVWEYWKGQIWESLIGPVDADPTNFMATSDQAITFVVPEDWASTAVGGITARWMRVRLVSGSYDKLRVISWYDSKSALSNAKQDQINFIPIIETQPPMIESFYLGYTYTSGPIAPTYCLSYNDFQYKDHSSALQPQPAQANLSPYQPIADELPALYLGFDKPLPTDLISLYLDRDEAEDSQAAPRLIWEQSNGQNWSELSVTDETGDLAKPGMVSFIAQPPATPPLQLTIVQSSGDRIQTSDARTTARLQAGDLVYVEKNDSGELATVQSVSGSVVQLKTSLSGTYTGGQVSLAGLARFGTPRAWVRARLAEESEPLSATIKGLHLNAVWAAQHQSVSDEVLGSSNGQPDQTFFLSQTPVLDREHIEVRELYGARAAVELEILTEELCTHGLSAADIRTVTESRTSRVNEVWVCWQERPHLYFAGPDDRHYVVERARGRLIFGNGVRGKIPPAGANNLLARQYQAGGGKAGNVSAGAITQLLSAAAPAQSVTNPRAAEGGADGELVTAVRWRGPQDQHHRWCAMAAQDYAALARESSPGVAVAQVRPTSRPDAQYAPGWVTVVIVPQSDEARPQPSLELRRQVQHYLAARAPASVTGIVVIGPVYLQVGVEVTVIPREVDQAGQVEQRVRVALERFLHPLSGGPDGQGWPFGRDVYVSDVAAALEGLDGVDYVRELSLLDDSPQGEQVSVPVDKMVAAGSIRVRIAAGREG